MAENSKARRRLRPNGFLLAGLVLLVFAQLGRTASHYLGVRAGWVTFALLAAAFLAHNGTRIVVHKRFAKLVQTAGVEHDARRYRETLELCDRALAMARKWKFTADDMLALAFWMRAEALKNLNKNQEALEASACAFACMCGVRKARTQLVIFDQLGTMLLNTGYARRAIPLLEAAVGLGHRYDANPMETVIRLERAGLACSRVGVHANAAAAFGQAIDVLVKATGPDTPELASLYINLGNAYKRMDKLEDAERCYRETLRVYEVNGVNDAEKISLALLNLGVACAESGRNAEAEQHFLEALRLRIGILGRNHWRVGNAYNNLAGCRRRMRDFNGAETYIRQAMEILHDRPESLCNAIETLSRLREDQGRVEEALAATTRARELQQSLPSPDLSELATLFEREALLAQRCSDEERAADCRQRAAETRQALAAAPPADRDLTNLPQSLHALEQHLASSLERVRGLEAAIKT